MCAGMLNRVQLFATPWTVAHQTPLSMWFSRQEYRRGLPCPSSGCLPDPRIKPTSPALDALTLSQQRSSYYLILLINYHQCY